MNIMGSDIVYALCFYAAAAVAVASAVVVIGARNPVINALFLVVCFFAVAVIYVLLQAHFLAAVQVLLYAGAVLVLFLMIIMLLNLNERELTKAKPTLGKAAGLAAVFGLVLMMVSVLSHLSISAPKPGLATREELAAFLIGMGEKPSALSVKVRGALTAEEKVAVARSVLNTLEDEENFQWVIWPKRFRGVSGDKLLSLGREIEKMLEANKAAELKALESPSGYTEFSSEDLTLFIETVVRGRLRQYQEYGSTAAVGRELFAGYALPFEAASILLLGAIIGVMVLARKKPGEGAKP